MLISQTSELHDQISELLTQLRRAKRQERERLDGATPVPAVTAPHYLKAYALVADAPQPEQLVELLLAAMGPGIWGSKGTLLRGIKGRIVVHHTKKVHQQVLRLLQEFGA